MQETKSCLVVSTKLLTPNHSPRLLNHKKDAKQEIPQGYIVWNGYKKKNKKNKK